MFSIIVQGPLHKHSLSRLQKYRKYGEVIVSHWEDDTLDPNDFDIEGVTFVKSNREHADTTFNCFNTWYHCYSTLQGLRVAQTPYAIKVRSDNFYGNLQPLLEQVLENPKKFNCGNLYFRPDAVQKFCPCDQIIGMETQLMLKTFELACWRMENQSSILRQGFNDHRQTTNLNYIYAQPIVSIVPNASEEMPRGVGVSPEVLIGTSFFGALNIQAFPDLSKDLMKQHFKIIRIEDLGMYLGKDGTNHIPHGGAEINTIEEI